MTRLRFAYRYVGDWEADFARSTGIVPNVDINGILKPVFLTPALFLSARRAERALQIGRYNPGGATAGPTHRIRVSLRGIKFSYAGNVAEGAGIEVITYDSPQVAHVVKLRP